MGFEFAGHLLRARREDRGLTRAELGHEAGCTESCITLYELGYRESPTPRLVLLAAHVEDLFSRTDTDAGARHPTDEATAVAEDPQASSAPARAP